MKKKLLFRLSAIVSGLSGLVILAGVLVPILTYEMGSRQKYPNLLSPISDTRNYNQPANYDLTKASNWFEGGAEPEKFTTSGISYYNLSIPKLGIENATVAIGGEDLAESLIHYPGTALPGKLGNSVVFGHSILPIFYNPKDYLAIFSTLPTLKTGDEIKIYYDGITFKYRVETMFEVLPTDIQVLDQDVSDSFLTLVTCVPPGDPRKPRRLIVRARIIPPWQANADIRY